MKPSVSFKRGRPFHLLAGAWLAAAAAVAGQVQSPNSFAMSIDSFESVPLGWTGGSYVITPYATQGVTEGNYSMQVGVPAGSVWQWLGKTFGADVYAAWYTNDILEIDVTLAPAAVGWSFGYCLGMNGAQGWQQQDETWQSQSAGSANRYTLRWDYRSIKASAPPTSTWWQLNLMLRVGAADPAQTVYVDNLRFLQRAYVTARPSPSGAGANPDGTCHEFTSSGGSILLGDSSARSSVADAPARSGARAYLGSTTLTNPAAGFSLSPTLPVPGGAYLLESTFNAGAGNINTDLVLAVSCTNCSLSVSNTDRFQARFGNSAWQTIGYLTNDAGSSTPWLDFRYLRGYVNAAANKRLNVDCFRFTFLAPPPSGPPSIVSPPQSQTNDTGATVTFSVIAAGTAPLSYQWLKDGAALADGGKVSGATTPGFRGPTLWKLLPTSTVRLWPWATTA